VWRKGGGGYELSGFGRPAAIGMWAAGVSIKDTQYDLYSHGYTRRKPFICNDLMKILPVLSLNYLQFSTRRHHKRPLNTTCWGVSIWQSFHHLRRLNGFDPLAVRLNQFLQSIFSTAIHENLIVGGARWGRL
jgi:hypothetical protein